MRNRRGASAKLLRRIDGGKAVMLLTVALALEHRAICTLAEHQLASVFSASDAAFYMDGLIALTEPVKAFFCRRPQLRDPGDELVLEAAVNGQADAIVTLNEGQLREARKSFRIEMIRPAEALRRVENDHPGF